MAARGGRSGREIYTVIQTSGELKNLRKGVSIVFYVANIHFLTFLDPAEITV